MLAHLGGCMRTYTLAWSQLRACLSAKTALVCSARLGIDEALSGLHLSGIFACLQCSTTPAPSKHARLKQFDPQLHITYSW